MNEPSFEGFQNRRLSLEANVLFRLERASRVREMHVLRGAVWLTGTPAEDDVILLPSDRFQTEARFPFLIQALEPAEVLLIPLTAKASRSQSAQRSSFILKHTLFCLERIRIQPRTHSTHE